MSRLIVALTLVALTLAAPMAGAQATTSTSASTTDSAAARASSDGIPRPANDSLFRRARRLVSEGNGTAGRALVDSLLATADPATSAYGDALYWHGALAPTAAAAEQDYRRVIVEYPLAYYSGDALLAIAELEQARGDRVGAMQHLQRFVREHPENPGRGIAALGVARLAFEQQDSTLACSMLVVARRSTPASDVEVRNQIAYFGNRCASVSAGTTTTAAAPASSPPAAVASAPQAAPAPAPETKHAPEAKRASVSAAPVATAPARAAAVAKTPARNTTVAKAPAREATTTKATATTPAKRVMTARRAPARETRETRETREARETHAARAESRATTHTPPRTATRYTVQLAAYDTHAEADALVKRLAARGVKARVSGSSKPFRVRLGLHASRKDAAAEAASLRKRGINGFVADEDVHVGARTP